MWSLLARPRAILRRGRSSLPRIAEGFGDVGLSAEVIGAVGFAGFLFWRRDAGVFFGLAESRGLCLNFFDIPGAGAVTLRTMRLLLESSLGIPLDFRGFVAIVGRWLLGWIAEVFFVVSQ